MVTVTITMTATAIAPMTIIVLSTPPATHESPYPVQIPRNGLWTQAQPQKIATC